jgi:hypothetical protein
MGGRMLSTGAPPVGLAIPKTLNFEHLEDGDSGSGPYVECC